MHRAHADRCVWCRACWLALQFAATKERRRHYSGWLAKVIIIMRLVQEMRWICLGIWLMLALGVKDRPASAVAEDAGLAQNCTALLGEVQPGGLNASTVLSLAEAVGGAYLAPLTWLAAQRFFPFPSHDNLTLQAYEMHPADAPDAGAGSSADLPVLVYCAGWTETSLKYSAFLLDLVQRGHSVYSFDFRGQGFSQNTGYDLGRYTHAHTFGEYVEDMRLFVAHVRGRHPGRAVSYVGNSLSGLVGLSTQLAYPGTFSRLAIAAPVIKPTATLNPVLRYALRWAHALGLGDRLLVRLGSDIAGLKLTHNEAIAEGWRRMREVAPAQLMVQGPSLGWLSTLTEQGHHVLFRAHEMPSPLLVFVGSHDIFVDNQSIFEYAHAYGPGAVTVLKFADCWHEIYTEAPRVYGRVMAELTVFLRE